jgi:hypothetical protein
VEPGDRRADETGGTEPEDPATESDGTAEPEEQERTETSEGSDSQQAAEEDLVQRQEALARELEQLREQMKKALERLQEEEQSGESSPSAQSLREALEEALKNLADRDPLEAMKEAAEKLANSELSEATEPQQKALRDLGALYHVLLRSQEAMQMAMMKFEVASLRRLAADLLALSAQEEEVAGLIPSDLRNVRSGELTRRQFRILQAARRLRDQLQDLSTSTPMQTMILVQKVDELIAKLGQTVESLQAGWGAQARRSARQSLAGLNKIVIDLLTQAHRVSAGAGSCTMPSLGQQLRQMAREQAGLNGLAQQLREQLQRQGLSQETRAQMERLQSEQGSLGGQARDLADLQRELEDGQRLLGNLEHLAEEMEKVAQDFEQGFLNEETLARQERILSRLLDMHNSVRKRDFTSRRESRTAADLFRRQGNGALEPGQAPETAPFRLRYQPVEKAPLEYRELVRRYFRAVEKLLGPVGGWNADGGPTGELP